MIRSRGPKRKADDDNTDNADVVPTAKQARSSSPAAGAGAGAAGSGSDAAAPTPASAAGGAADSTADAAVTKAPKPASPGTSAGGATGATAAAPSASGGDSATGAGGGKPDVSKEGESKAAADSGAGEAAGAGAGAGAGASADAGDATADVDMGGKGGSPPPAAGDAAGAEVEVEDPARVAELQQLARELAAAEAERAGIEAGTNPELKREVRAYNARKRAALATAESFSKWRIASVKAQLAYEKEAAQKVCENQCAAAQASRLADVDEKIKQIKERQQGVTHKHPMRKLRSSHHRSGRDDSDSPALPHSENPFKPYILGVDPPLKTSLSTDAVLEDLKAVHADWLTQAKKFKRGQPKELDTTIRLERGRLLCDGDVFERGEHVVVTSEVTGQTFYGSITSLGSIEVGVRLSDGTRSRVPITMLQQGRCRLRHQQA